MRRYVVAQKQLFAVEMLVFSFIFLKISHLFAKARVNIFRLWLCAGDVFFFVFDHFHYAPELRFFIMRKW